MEFHEIIHFNHFISVVFRGYMKNTFHIVFTRANTMIRGQCGLFPGIRLMKVISIVLLQIQYV